MITTSKDPKNLNGILSNNWDAIEQCHRDLWPELETPEKIPSWHTKDSRVGFNTSMAAWNAAIASLVWAVKRPRLQNDNGPANFTIHSLVAECVRLNPDFVLTQYRLGDGAPIQFKVSEFNCFFPAGSVYTENAWLSAQPLWDHIGLDRRRTWFANCNPGNPSIGHFISFCLDPHVLAYDPAWYHHGLMLLRQISSGLSSSFPRLRIPSDLDGVRVKRLKLSEQVIFQLMIDCKNLLMLPRDDTEKVPYSLTPQP